mgnify:CR=1 FL=1
MDTKTRIEKGIIFFRKVGGRNYDSEMVKKYLPKFLDMVESYIHQMEPEDNQDDLFEESKKIFGVKNE